MAWSVYTDANDRWFYVVGEISPPHNENGRWVVARAIKQPPGEFVGVGSTKPYSIGEFVGSESAPLIYKVEAYRPEFDGDPEVINAWDYRAPKTPVCIVLPGPRALDGRVCPDLTCLTPGGHNLYGEALTVRSHTQTCAYKDLPPDKFEEILQAHERLLALGERI